MDQSGLLAHNIGLAPGFPAKIGRFLPAQYGWKFPALTSASCEIYEIKHSTEIVPEQARHLIDQEKCTMTEHRYGPITRKTVLYRGATQDVDGIRYVNVEKYLKGVG